MGRIWTDFLNKLGLVIARFSGSCCQGNCNLFELVWIELSHKVLHVFCFRLSVGCWARFLDLQLRNSSCFVVILAGYGQFNLLVGEVCDACPECWTRSAVLASNSATSFSITCISRNAIWHAVWASCNVSAGAGGAAKCFLSESARSGKKSCISSMRACNKGMRASLASADLLDLSEVALSLIHT